MTIDDQAARTLLSDERRRLEYAQSGVESDLAEERSGASDELGSYDQDPAEAGTEVEDMSRDLGLRADFAVLLRENDAALLRVDEGRYGVCERCGRRITDERLQAMPSTRYCIDHVRAPA